MRYLVRGGAGQLGELLRGVSDARVAAEIVFFHRNQTLARSRADVEHVVLDIDSRRLSFGPSSHY
jgi:hypothetical protein